MLLEVRCNLRKIRERKGITMRQLEEKSGVSIAQISYIENEKSYATVPTAYLLATSLEVGLEEIYSFEIK